MFKSFAQSYLLFTIFKGAVMTTAYVYDPIFLKHTKAGHPENAARLQAIMAELETSGLLDSLYHMPSRAATHDELCLIHDASYVKQVQSISKAGDGHLDMDTYVTAHTYQAAAVAAGTTVDLTRAVLEGTLDNGFALVRPPGHHAFSFQGMGFCVFNNIVLAARMAQARGIERIAIVDFDVHHGNGTQSMTEHDSAILFISTHQYPFYPGTGGVTEIGRREGAGFTLNLPLPVGVGDLGFQALYTEIVIPALRRFAPQLILVSAGYDAHWVDPLAGLGLSLSGYAWITQTLVALANELCDGHLVFVLEGGYNLTVSKVGVANTFKSLLGRDDYEDPLGPADWDAPDLTQYITEVKKIHNL